MAVDTGTTLTMIPKTLFDRLNTVLKGTPLSNGIYSLECKSVKAISPMTFKFGTVTLTLTWEQLVILDQESKKCISIFQPNSDSDQMSILGATFISNFYTLFDYTGLRVGFAKSAGQQAPVIPNSASTTVQSLLLKLLMLFMILQ
jgi:saccharopepsin